MKLLDALVTFAEDNTGEDKWKSEALSVVKLRVWVMGLVIGCTGLLCNGATQESTIGREGEPIKPRTGGGPNDPHPRVDCYVTSSL